MNIVMMNPNELQPYPGNPRRNDQSVDQVARSIREFGFNQPIVVDANRVIVVGHTRLKAAKKLGLDQVPVIIVDTVSEEKLQAYRLADNKLNELAQWDDSLLIDELTEIIARGDQHLTGFSQEELDELLGTDEPLTDHSAYTKKIDTPVYTPKGEKPEITELYDQARTEQLIRDIQDSTATEEEKQFLTAAARRHTVFDYHNIAEYYCHATAEVQDLMERSALVIIDFDQAIEQGYVKLSNELRDIYATSYQDVEDEQ
jgi:hypothetical protein